MFDSRCGRVRGGWTYTSAALAAAQASLGLLGAGVIYSIYRLVQHTAIPGSDIFALSLLECAVLSSATAKELSPGVPVTS